MDKIIYAKSMEFNIINELKMEDIVHSVFKNGINIISENGLIFIGLDFKGKAPYGIYLFNKKDFGKLEFLVRGDKYYFDKENLQLSFNNIIIDFKKTEFYSSKMLMKENDIDEDSFKFLYEEITRLETSTGFDMKILEFISNYNPLISDFRKALLSNDEVIIEKLLRRIIGRGKGLTPSGDDFLIGLIWLSNLLNFMDYKYINTMNNLINNEVLTTDISINYYNRAFNGEFSSYLIELYKSLMENNEDKIRNYIHKIVDFGHTSGIDTLTGIAFGINLAKGYIL